MRRLSAPGRLSSAGDAFWAEPIASSQEAEELVVWVGCAGKGQAVSASPGCRMWRSRSTAVSQDESRRSTTTSPSALPVTRLRMHAYPQIVLDERLDADERAADTSSHRWIQTSQVLAFGPDCGLAKARGTEAEANGREGAVGEGDFERSPRRYGLCILLPAMLLAVLARAQEHHVRVSESGCRRSRGTRLLEEQQDDSRTRMSCYSWESKQRRMLECSDRGSAKVDGRSRETGSCGLMREVVSLESSSRLTVWCSDGFSSTLDGIRAAYEPSWTSRKSPRTHLSTALTVLLPGDSGLRVGTLFQSPACFNDKVARQMREELLQR
ncbi:hypothetical protein C8F01DRAFT_1087447 [Mycena amicta]|nr:hypothetical protein C8F01DRAFT_1087447 [Mycena amicta]